MSDVETYWQATQMITPHHPACQRPRIDLRPRSTWRTRWTSRSGCECADLPPDAPRWANSI